MQKKTLLLVGALLFILAGCAGMDLKLKNWQELPDEHYTIPPFASRLSEFKVALDPGHGGNAHLPGYKRGPSGEREAVMNLNVARFLKEFLEKAGAEVLLTREDDSFIALQDRADMAFEAGCDFMISLHHNASGNPETNYSAIFYHLTPDTSPSSMDLARNIYFGLTEALRLPQVVGDGLLTDKIIYPAGFGLLRRSRIPAILLESSFYSNTKEEKRLTDQRYNRREAYGIFLGLARWAAGGVPSTKLIKPAGVSRTKTPEVAYHLKDGITELGGRNLAELLIFSESVSARIDGQAVDVELSADKRSLSFAPDSALSNGRHTVQVDLQNMFKNHNLPQTDTLTIAAPTDSIRFEMASEYLAADSLTQMPIVLHLFDADSQAVWDSTRLILRASKGTIRPEHPVLVDGRALAYFRGAPEFGLSTITATADSKVDTLFLSLIPQGQVWTLSGTVTDDSTRRPIADVEVALNDSVFSLTDENGVYFMLNPPVGPGRLVLKINGFEEIAVGIEIDSTRSVLRNFELAALLDGLLHDEVFILDAAHGDSLAGDLFPDSVTSAQANLKLAKTLSATLARAGAQPILVRENATWLSSRDRVKMVNQMPEGWYLQLVYEFQDSDSLEVVTTIYPANKKAEKLGTAILGAFSDLAASDTLLQNTKVPEVTYTNKTALQLTIRCRAPEVSQRDALRILAGLVKFMRAMQETAD